ncbi:MAG TPA: aspartate/glutamate racemase family protein, partial [Candidatus Saccharimonadales bacterium]|nr:aspartate/glutamate racemase family protein [Candidatus Saccharimonadales bacterium]
REEFPVPMIGMEPMVKPAAERTKSKIIAVLATPRTLSSERYRELKDKYARGIKIIEPDVSNWAMMIENNSVERDKVAEIIEGSIVAGADEIVLGCTHYHWIEEMINKVAEGRAEVIQPERPIIERLKRVIEQTS